MQDLLASEIALSIWGHAELFSATVLLDEGLKGLFTLVEVNDFRV